MVQFNKESKRYVVRGFVEPGYEAVYDRFCSHFESGVEECAQVCAFVKGKVVVNSLLETWKQPYIRIGEIVPVLTLTAPTGPAAPSQCPFRVRTGHPIIARELDRKRTPRG